MRSRLILSANPSAAVPPRPSTAANSSFKRSELGALLHRGAGVVVTDWEGLPVRLVFLEAKIAQKYVAGVRERIPAGSLPGPR